MNSNHNRTQRPVVPPNPNGEAPQAEAPTSTSTTSKDTSNQSTTVEKEESSLQVAAANYGSQLTGLSAQLTNEATEIGQALAETLYEEALTLGILQGQTIALERVGKNVLAAQSAGIKNRIANFTMSVSAPEAIASPNRNTPNLNSFF